MSDKGALHAGFWLLSDVLLYQVWLFLTTLSSDVCLAVNGEDNYGWLYENTDIATKWIADTIKQVEINNGMTGRLQIVN